MSEEIKLTPAMKQYYEMKEEYKDSVLFFRMGDFYEMFDDDAHIAHKVLGISITTRNKNAANPTPLAGIPFHAMEKYLPMLVNAGYKVAISEQVSDPKLKGIVQREVVRVVTPATLSLEGDSYSGGEDSNVIVSIVSNKLGFGISYVDISSSKWKTGEFSCFNALASELYKMSPKEVVLDKALFDNVEIKNLLSKKYSLNIYFFDFKGDSREKLLTHFETSNLEGFYLEKKLNAQKASAMLLEYLEMNQKSSLDFLKSISYEKFDEFMGIDENTIKNLDLIYNFSTKSSTVGTLFGVLNESKTAMGNRALKEAIVKPLQDIDKINDRLSIIEEFLKDPILLSKVQDKLKMVSDIDLIMNRLYLGRAMPKDLLNLKRSLISVVEVCDLIKDSGNKVLIKLFNLG